MSTHTLSVAEEIADRIGIIDQGRLRFLGTMDELRRETTDHQTSLEGIFLELTGPHEGDPSRWALRVKMDSGCNS